VIFLTIGSHEPFDRLVQAVDEWCDQNNLGSQVFAQITGHAQYRPRNFRFVEQLGFTEYNRCVEQSRFMISHVGMGTIISALSARKPIVVLPRRGQLNETRNDHQFDSLRLVRTLRGVFAAEDEQQLPLHLSDVNSLAAGTYEMPELQPYADAGLIKALRDAIQTSKVKIEVGATSHA
jgi:UDP-N-acetylglucosamine transferase subunit ALG13